MTQASLDKQSTRVTRKDRQALRGEACQVERTTNGESYCTEGHISVEQYDQQTRDALLRVIR